MEDHSRRRRTDRRLDTSHDARPDARLDRRCGACHGTWLDNCRGVRIHDDRSLDTEARLRSFDAWVAS